MLPKILLLYSDVHMNKKTGYLLLMITYARITEIKWGNFSQ